MVGKFLLGMVSGGLVVIGGLVVGSAVLGPAANDNVARQSAAESTIAAPKAADADAGPAVPAPVTETPDTETPVTEAPDTEAADTEAPVAEAPVADAAPAEAQTQDPAAATTATDSVTPTPAAPAPDTPDTSTSDTANPDAAASKASASDLAAGPADTTAELEPVESKPAVVADDPGPSVPMPDTMALTDPVAPAPTAVIPPKPTMPPTKPADAAADVPADIVADVAADVPETAPSAPVDPVTTATAPTPAVEDAPTVAEAAPVAQPAVEPGSEPDVADAAPAPDAGAGADEMAVTPVPADPEAPAPAVVAAAPDPTEDAGGSAGVSGGASSGAMAVAEAEVAPQTDPLMPTLDTPAPATDDAAVVMPGTKPAPLPGTPEAPPIAEVAEAEAAPAAGSTFKPAPRLIDQGEGVIVGRATDTDEPVPDATADAGASPADPRPIAQFAATFENPDAKPPMAIVLIDRGQADLDRAGLAALPLPVSFALDPLDPASAAHAAIYRAAGREVVMLVTGIADGAQASDVEVAFQSMDQGLPEAVAVMDLAEPAFQNNRQLAAAVVPILKSDGRGLLTWDAGLNAADQVARREDLEAATVFRDLATAGTDKVAMRRLLDRAVFKAGQDGRVSVVGEASPETVAALLEWSVEGKAATVVLAPVTAVLTVE